jgi:tetratricopeptide (TPR) repeat protein
MRMPNTEKYLEYSLRGVQLDVGSPDSATSSFKYLHASNALFQAGFFDEALLHADKSIALNPYNPYSGYLRIYIRYMSHRDLSRTKRELLEILRQDTNRIDMLQELGKVSYFNREYQDAYRYYRRFLELRETYQLDIFRHEFLTMAAVCRELGKSDEAERLLKEYKQFADESKTRYKHLHLAMYYVYLNDTEKALEHLGLFANEHNFSSLTLLMPEDPLLESLKNNPEFIRLMKKIEDQFWRDHKRLRDRMEEKGLI